MTKMDETVSLKVNGHTVTVPKSSTVLQACKQAEIEVPVFCYHPKLSVAGNCRMCLVQVGNSPKPVASCAMPVAEGMEVSTTSEMVQKARKGVMEFLLINHPLDCPICDQGGECDLQDLSMGYGCGKSRYQEEKRAVPNPDLGPLIKTIMNRCIHCMRCVRFGNEIAGIPELGALDRGENAKVMTVVGETVRSELSGNMIDICPVGALTAKPYAFEGRAWEFNHTNSLDIHDAVGSHIRIDTRAGEVMRIVPRACDEINEDWGTDKARFSCDGLKRQRLDRCYVKKDGKLSAVQPDEAIEKVVKLLDKTPSDKIGFLAGPLVDAETLFSVKHLADKIGTPYTECRVHEGFLPVKNGADYLFNTSIKGIEEADACLIVGANPRFEAPMLNARLRKAVQKGLKIGLVGEAVDLALSYEHVSADLAALNNLEDQSSEFMTAFKTAKKPMVIVGGAIERHHEAESLYARCLEIYESHKGKEKAWNGFNYMPLEASRVAALTLGFYGEGERQLPSALKKKKLDVLVLLGVEEVDPKLLEGVTVIYLGHHGERGAHQADIILPTPAFHEKEGTYINLEGRIQKTEKALDPVGEALPEWQWVSRVLKGLNHSCFDEPKTVQEALHQSLQKGSDRKLSASKEYGCKKISKETYIRSPITNFYMTDVISRASETMAKCTESFYEPEKKEAS